MREGGPGGVLVRSVRARFAPTLATLLLPVLLGGLLTVAGTHPQAPAQARIPPAAPAVSNGARTRPLPESTPTPWPDRPWFAPPVVSNGDVPDLAPHARAVILVDLGTRRTLYEQGALKPLPAASLVKLVTVMVALRHASLQTVLTIPAAATEVGSDETRMGLGAGEQLTVEELIEGIFLQSANDAALVLAQAIIPEARFIEEMNDLVRSWGLTGASFTNPTGLDAPGEVASAYDLAVVAAHLIREQPELLMISGQRRIQIPQTPSHKGYDLPSLIGPVLRGFPGADGLKTGFTDNAGYCLALTDHRGHRRLLAVVLNSPTDVDDAQALVTYGFSVDGA